MKAVEEIKSKSILDLFSIDLFTLPDYSFTSVEHEVSPSGYNIYNLTKVLFNRECELFDEVNIKIYDNGKVKNLVFTCKEESFDLVPVRKLVDSISAIYGVDLLGRGNFDENDKRQIARGYWVGRVYSDPHRFEVPLIFTLNDTRLQLMITIRQSKES